MHPEFSEKHSKPGAKKQISIKTYEHFFSFMTQQEDNCLNNQPTSGTADFINSMVDRIAP